MSPQLMTTLIVLLFLIYALVTKIVPFGVSAMLSCVILVMIGVVPLKTGFSGLSSTTTIMVAGMIVVAQQLGKTSLVNNIKLRLNNLKGKSSYAILIPLTLVTILLSQLMGQIAALSILLIFLQTLDDDSELNPGRIFYLLVVINTIWISRIPIGMGATMPMLLNSFYEGMVNDSEKMLGILDFFKAGIIPSVLVTIYSLVFYKLIPETKSNINAKDTKLEEVKETNLTSFQEKVVFAVFIVIMISFMFQDLVGKDRVNTLPALGVLIFIISKVMSAKEARDAISSDMVWMVIGMQGMSSILSETGLGELIGNSVLKILGENSSPIMIVSAFVIITSIMTNFVSNMGTMAMMTPIAASSAIAAGIDPKMVVLAVGVSCWFAFLLPTGSAGAVMGFAYGNHNPKSLLKFSLPALLLLDIGLIINLKLMFGI